MGTRRCLSCLIWSLLAGVAVAAEPAPSIVERGPHHQVVERITRVRLPNGRDVEQQSRLVELQTGMHYRDGDSWVESVERIDAHPDGAVAHHGQHKVAFAANLNTRGAIQLVDADGQRFSSHVLGLAFTDMATGDSVLIAEVKDVTGRIQAPNQILYADAFKEVTADVRFTYRRDGLEQDIILREALPVGPRDFGMNPETTRLEVFTEFIEAPEGRAVPSTLRTELDPVRRDSMVVPDFTDHDLHFGAMSIGKGRAIDFQGVLKSDLPVGKTWEVRDGRTVLVEAVEYAAVSPALDELPRRGAGPKPGARAGKANPVRNAAGAVRTFPAPPRQRAAVDRQPMRLIAQVGPVKGVLIDYSMILATGQTNYTFLTEVTHRVRGPINLYGTTTINGGTVVKYSREASNASVSLHGTVVCDTTPLRPAYFTAEDDLSIGSPVSSNPLTNYYAAAALRATATVTGTLHDLHFNFARTAIEWQGSTERFSNLKFMNCSNAIVRVDGGTSAVHNVLATNVQNLFVGSNTTIHAQHVTAHKVNTLSRLQGGPSTLSLTNCVLVNITNLGTNVVVGDYLGTNSTPAISGVTHGFTSTQAIFQTVVGGDHYLNTNSPLRDVGTTNVAPELLQELRRATTYPPLFFTNRVTNDTVFSIVASRDTNGLDLGYHYPPLDYVVSQCIIESNATLRLTNGVAIGVDYSVLDGSGAGCGFNFSSGHLLSIGSPTRMNAIVRAHCVQERSTGNPGNQSMFLDYFDGGSLATESSARFRFTEFAAVSEDGYMFLGGTGWKHLEWTHCDLHFALTDVGNGTNQVFGVTNCVFTRSPFWMWPGGVGSSAHVRNSTMYYSYLGLIGGNTNWTVQDNLFDSMIFLSDYGSSVSNSHNAYFQSNSVLSAGAHNLMLTNLSYVRGPLGKFYQPTNSPLLNAGSRNATNAGLYHFTTTTNQAPETNSTVDIGFHYVALDGQGNPLDSNTNGIPNYLADANGDGFVNGGETPFTRITISITTPVNHDAPATVALTTSASIPYSQITLVEYFFGSTNLGSSSTAPYTVNWPNLPSGRYTVTARATAWAGLMATSAPVEIRVNNALFVVGSTNLPGSTIPENTDHDIYLRLLTNGFYTHVLRDSDVTTADSNGKLLVAISRSAVPANVGYKFTSNAVPLVTWNDDLYDELGFVATSSSFGSINTQKNLTILNTSNSMSAGLSGVVAAAGWATNFSWGTPNSNAVRIAGLTFDTNKCGVFGYEANASMPALEAPARRVAFFLGKTASTNVTSFGWSLFNAALQWATNVNVVPFATWLGPTNTGILPGGTNLTLSAKAFDNDSGLRKVKFYHDGVRIGVASSITNHTNSLVWSNVVGGNYFMSARAVDNGGLITASTQLLNLIVRSNILFVVSTTNPLNSSEVAISNRLATNGFTVTVKSAGSVTNADALGKSLILISSTVNSTNVGNKFTQASAPVMVWKKELFNHLGMTATNVPADTIYSTESLVHVAIASSVTNHAMAAGLSGNVQVVTNASSMNWAKPGSNAVLIATLTNDATKAAIFGYEKGDLMLGIAGEQFAAPARRVGFMLTGNNAILINSNGWKLFDAALRWAMEKPCYEAMDVMLVIDNSQSMTNRALPDAKEAAIRFLSLFNLSVDKVGVVYFASNATTAHQLSHDQASIAASITAIQMSTIGQTRIDKAITNALLELTGTNRNPNAQPVMIVMSDGIPTGNSSNLTVNIAKEAKDYGIRVFTVGFGEANATLMTTIASTPTDYYFAPDSDDLLDLYNAVADSLCKLSGPPTVTITNPTPGAVFNYPANVLIEASATDNDGLVTNVTFYAGTNLLGSDASAPFSLTWTNPSDGSYELIAVAKDNLGLSATSSPVSILVQDIPTVVILTPTDGESLLLSPTNISITATAGSPASAISYVQFFEGTNSIGIRTETPYTNNWRPVFGGLYALTAKAVNTRGRASTSNPVVVNVNFAPVVTLTAPINGSIYPVPNTNITVSATASDTNGLIVQVEFFNGTTSLGVDTDMPYSVSWSSVPAGTYNLWARATDNQGATAVSDSARITVHSTNAPPYVFAGSNQIIRLPANAILRGIVIDDGLPNGTVTSYWQKVSGPGIVWFAPSNSPVAEASFDSEGTNILQLVAYDGQFRVTNQMTVFVLPTNAPPIVNAGSSLITILPGIDRASNSLSVTMLTVATNFINTVGVDYVATSNALVVSDGHPRSASLILLSGVNTLSVLASNLGGGFAADSKEIMIATVRETNGGFRVGDMFCGSWVDGSIARVAPTGVVENPYITFAELAGQDSPDFNGGICIDRTGIFGGDLIVAAGGHVWRVNASKVVTHVTGSTSPLAWVTTVPDQPDRYGPLAGKIVGVGQGGTEIYTISTNGSVGSLSLGFPEAIESMLVVQANENLFAAGPRYPGFTSQIIGGLASQLSQYVGDIIVCEEGSANLGPPYAKLWLIKWVGTNTPNTAGFIKKPISEHNHWEQMTFVPLDVGQMPAIAAIPLTGSVTDDGRPNGVTNTLWESVSGAGPVTFADSNSPVSSARLSEPGEYVLRLRADDGELTNAAEIRITAIQNQAPIVFAGTNWVGANRQVFLRGSATDDGYPSNFLQTAWSLAQADAGKTATFANSNALETVVTLSSTGQYVLRLMASDGQAKAFADVLVEVTSTYSAPPTGTNNTNFANIVVSMSGTGLGNFSSINFGETPVGTPVERTVTIGNSGTAPLHLLLVTNWGDFQITGDTTTAIPINGSTELTIQFQATTNLGLPGIMWISSDDGNSGDGVQNPFLLNLVARAYPTGSVPVIALTNPVASTVFFAPASIPVAASVTSAATLDKIEFMVEGSLSGKIGQVRGYEASGISWESVPPGTYRISAVAHDVLGRIARSSSVVVTVLSNSPPVAVDDSYVVLVNSSPTLLTVLGNDTDPDGDSLSIVGFYRTGAGTATIVNDGKGVRYAPPLNTQGWDGFDYIIQDKHGRQSGASVSIRLVVPSAPTVSLALDPSGGTYVGGTALKLTATPLEAQGEISRVDFFEDGRLIGSATSSPYTNRWEAIVGTTELSAVIYDTLGQQGDATVSIQVTNKPGDVTLPYAKISNLTNQVRQVDGKWITNEIAVVRDGLFVLRGSAYDLDNDPVRYKLRLYRFDGTLVRDLTPTWIFQSVTNGPLFTNDFTMLRNDVYMVELLVTAGGRQASNWITFALESELKVGHFSFSQQDMVIPAAGLPLSVIRTYSTLNPNSGDFGNSWTYSLHDLEMSINEDRAPTEDVEDDAGEPQIFSLRVGGGRDVTLTLPDSRRTTFAFYLESGPCNEGDDVSFCYRAKWAAPSDVYYTLEPTTDNRLYALFGSVWWAADSGAGYENYDFPAFILTSRDGTQYHIEREDLGEHWFLSGISFGNAVHAYGQGKLKKITQRTGDTISIATGSITHTNAAGQLTRQVTFQRDSIGRIVSIVDPNSTTNVPAVKYEYDFFGNLVRVLKLTDRVTASYETNTYVYGNLNFPSYITEIRDARGATPLRTLYDSDGRMIGTVDAFGKTNSFAHAISNRTEIVTDRLGRSTTHGYDTNGNVVFTINALSQVTYRNYDANNNLIEEVDGLGHTNRYGYDVNGNRTAMTNALGHFTLMTYDTNNQVLSVTDSRDNTTWNAYDARGNLTFTTNALNLLTTFVYDTNSHLISQRDALGNVTTNQYDGLGNITSTAVKDANNIVLTSISYGYDNNGNRTSQTLTRSLTNGATENLITTWIYDAQNRVVQTIDPDGFTNRVIYNAIGQQQYTVDKLGRTNAFEYDDAGRLFKHTYPDNSFELSYYDSEGRRTNMVDRAGRSTLYVYDELGRMNQTVYADGATSTTVYDPAGRVAYTVDARGNTNAFGYDEAGRRTTVTNALHVPGVQTVTFSKYDEAGNLTNVVDAAGRSMDYVYDALNRRDKAIMPATESGGTRATTFTGYDAVGRRVAETNEAGLVTRFGYDGLGRMMAVTNAWGTSDANWATYAFDEAGNQTNQVDALGRVTKFQHDKLGRRTVRRLPSGDPETYGYDALGNLVAHTNFNGLVITNRYDVMNRLVARGALSVGVLETYAYAVSGPLTNRVDESGAYAWRYDVRDRVRTNSTPVGTLFYDYDQNGNLTNLSSSTAGGVATSYRYDALNRITNTTDNTLGAATRYGFDAVGNLATLQYPNGVTNLWQYDTRNRLTNEVWKLNTTTLASFFYKLAVSSQRTNLSEVINGTSRDFAWNYDQQYRLTNEVAGGLGNLAYKYDVVGNRTNRTSSVSGLNNQTPSYTTNDWLTSDTYDTNGNTTASGSIAYKYDWANRLTNANSGTVVITYNAEGQRIKKVAGGVTTLYLVDTRNPSGYAQVLEELTVSGGTTNLAKVFTYGLDLIGQRVPGTSTNYFGYDGHGSTRFLTDAGGGVVNTFTYDAYGTLVDSNGLAQTVYLYSGEQFDLDLGFYYLRARYLNPTTGRFWGMDSFEGNASSPLSLHKYLYVHANPVNGIDPSGHTSIAEVGVANLMGNILSRGGALVRLYQIKQRIETVFEFLDILRTFQDLPAMLQGEIGSLISSANPHNGPLSSFSLSHFEATVQQVMSDMPTIARLALGTHRKELTEFFGRTATRKTAQDARVVIYLPTSSAGGPRIVRDTPLQVRGTKLSVVAGGGGGRFWGVGIGEKVHGRIEPYQLFRVDYHGVRIRHHMSHTKFFNAEGHEFHWTVPHNPQEARD